MLVVMAAKATAVEDVQTQFAIDEDFELRATIGGTRHTHRVTPGMSLADANEAGIVALVRFKGPATVLDLATGSTLFEKQLVRRGPPHASVDRSGKVVVFGDAREVFLVQL